MVSLAALWLPILLSAVFVFIASSILHMALQLHKGEYGKLPGEENILEAMRKEGVTRGEYMFPCAGSFKDAGSPEMQEKYKQGPCGFMIVAPTGPPSMGKPLALWFIYSLVISIFVAYLASRTLAAGAEYLTVFRVTGTVAFLSYAMSHVQQSIWKHVAWRSTLLHLFDGLVYGLMTAGAFGWLWPS